MSHAARAIPPSPSSATTAVTVDDWRTIAESRAEEIASLRREIAARPVTVPMPTLGCLCKTCQQIRDRGHR